MSSEPLWFRLPPRSSVDPAPPPEVEKAMVSITIDGRALDVPAGTTIIDACKTLGIEIPTLCYLETLTPVNACRVCVVEVEGARVLAPACSRKVERGHGGQDAVAARRSVAQGGARIAGIVSGFDRRRRRSNRVDEEYGADPSGLARVWALRLLRP